MNEVISINNPNDEVKLKIFLLDHLFEVSVGDISTTYKLNNVSITVYKSGKVLLQGKESEKWYKEINQLLSYTNKINSKVEEIDPRIRQTFQRIGSDESGKGDFFGPLVTVAFYLESENQMKELEKLGIKDSKKLSDNKVIDLAKDIKKVGYYDRVLISPSKYNELYQKIGNLNALLAWSHAKAIENIIQKKPVQLIIIDKFADNKFITDVVKNSNTELILMTNAEREISVATASILARENYLKWIKNYTETTGISLPKGASNEVLNAATQIAKQRGLAYLNEIAKIHFNTYNTVKNKLNEL